MVSMNQDLSALLVQLSELALRNTATSVASRVRAIRKGKQLEAQVNELNDIINDLLDDRAQLVGVAQGLQDELVAQRISKEEIKYITDKLIPTIETLMQLSGDDGSQGDDTVRAMKTLVSAEMMTVLQLVGFNFKRAIGEPLTSLVATLIEGVGPVRRDTDADRLSVQREILLIEAAQDPETWARLQG